MAKFWEQNWFKKGAMLVGADIAGEYFFGETVPGMEGTGLQGRHKGSNRALENYWQASGYYA